MHFKKAADAIREIIMGAIESGKSIHRPLVDAIVDILNLEEEDGRCVLFSIDDRGIKGVDIFCEITAGFPDSKTEHGLRERESIERHADLKEVIRLASLMHIRDPEVNGITAGFHDHVVNKKITEIIYLPVVVREGERLKTFGIIVIDGINGRRFSEAEIDFCKNVGYLINTNIQFVEKFILHTQDKKNGVIGLAGLLKRIEKQQVQITNLSCLIKGLLLSSDSPAEVDFSEMSLSLQHILYLAAESEELTATVRSDLFAIEKNRLRKGVMEYGEEKK